MKYFDKLNTKENVRKARRKKTKEKLIRDANDKCYYDCQINFGFISLDDSKNKEYLDNLVYQKYLRDEYQGGNY